MLNYKKSFFFFLLNLLTHVSMFPSTYTYHLSEAWYPSKSKKKLEQTLSEMYKSSQQKFPSNLQSQSIKALIVPHAGYAYSGVVATSAYQNIKPKIFDRVIILAPSHHVDFEGVGLPGKEYAWYKNALGRIQLDGDLIKKLITSSELFSYQHRTHESEHSVEVQIPLIQKYCGFCKIVPLIIGKVTDLQMRNIAHVLSQVIDSKTLLVISSDFTHYGKSFNYVPFTTDILQNIFKLDSSLVQKIQTYDFDGFAKIISQTQATVCGKNPLMILLHMLKEKYLGDVGCYVVGYDTSAQDQKNPEHCVSYVGMVISSQQKKDLNLQDWLTGYEKNFLLKLARIRLQHVTTLNSKDQTVDNHLPGILTETLRQNQGAFVTLYAGLQKDLRGCIGSIVSTQSLYETIWDMAQASALHDSRFSPVQATQIPNISISISVLTEPTMISSYQDIQLGIDGIILKHGANQAVYLPKVAIEQKWNLSQTLSSLSQKAGLESDAWKDKATKFKVFQSIDFAEY